MKSKQISFREDKKQAKKRKTFRVIAEAGKAPVSIDLTGIKAKHVVVTLTDSSVSNTLFDSYAVLAVEMKQAELGLCFGERSLTEKILLANLLRRDLLYCLLDPKLDSLTAVYRNCPAENLLGYDPSAVSDFLQRFLFECSYEEDTEDPIGLKKALLFSKDDPSIISEQIDSIIRAMKKEEN